MQYELWREIVPRQRSKRKPVQRTIATPYSITGTNKDCEIIGHTLREWDLAGCTLCTDCSVKIFCPRCIAKHPQDETAIAILCERHEAPLESQVSA